MNLGVKVGFPSTGTKLGVEVYGTKVAGTRAPFKRVCWGVFVF
jgi:hypothetical protein